LKHTNISTTGSHRMEESGGRRGSTTPSLIESSARVATVAAPQLSAPSPAKGGTRTGPGGSSGIPGPRSRPPPAPPVRSNTTLQDQPPAARPRFETGSLDRKAEIQVSNTHLFDPMQINLKSKKELTYQLF